MNKIIFLLILIAFGLFYSASLYSYLGFYPSFVFILVTSGFTLTIYLLEKKADNKKIIYVWIALVVIALIALRI